MKYSVNAKSCPDALGAASKGTTAGRLVFVSAQLPVDENGALVAGGICEQAALVLDHVEAILSEVGLDLSDVAKTTVYLADLNDLEAFDDVYGGRIELPRPARTVVGDRDLPLGALVQMDAVACR
ncbi:RidA family protein [Paratractidigestivibacter sp.]|uniref:RidA family protein n=1 Tax=Paratractidigestivibacter sp. TaxID=2847316 RepID=UPI002ABE4A20|nr:Rid family hydrolase [Paratractidigestivibacter sp.]